MGHAGQRSTRAERIPYAGVMTDGTPTSATLRPDAVCDGGDLDCGSGLLLIVARALAPLAPGDLLELRSREPTVLDELPLWCESQGHTIVDVKMTSGPTCYQIRKGADADDEPAAVDSRSVVVRRTGDAWSRTSDDEAARVAIDSFLVGLAACLSDAVRRTGPGRAHSIDEVEVALEAAVPTEDALLEITGELRVEVALSAEEAEQLAAEAVAGSALVQALARPPRLITRPAAD